MNLRVEQEFHAPVDTLVFSFDLTENTLYLLDGQTCNGWVTPEHYREVAVVLKLPAHARGLAPLDHLILQPLRSPSCRPYATLLSGYLSGAMNGRFDIDQPGFSQQIADGCFLLLDEAAHHEPHRRTNCYSRRIVEGVKQLAHDSPFDCLSILDMAAATGVSVRHVQQSFLRYAGMSPTAWLKNRRLNAARRDLLRADPTEVTVAEIAMRWSFWHLGRFSHAYHTLFGEYPKTTLRRAL
ncbi:helix-turn-helix domain-containing protein [Pseudomonas sp. S37]|nr:helix-turn-helix domain-containing protein [Pseudomonas sp. S37]